MKKKSTISKTSDLQAVTALYERLLSEKDALHLAEDTEKNARIAELTAALEHERKKADEEKPKSHEGTWHFMKSKAYEFAFVAFLASACSSVQEISRRQTGASWALPVILFTFSMMFRFFYRFGVKVYRAWKAAAKISPAARYAVQFLYSALIGTATAMGFFFSGTSSPQIRYTDMVTFYWISLPAWALAVFSFFRMKTHTQEAGQPRPSWSQIGFWANLK